MRVSILPTNHGQAIVMRILDRENIKVGIRNLGFGEENYRRFQNIIRRPNGIFLVTGPTGSGKTTTLYSAIGELNRPDRKIITAEDPVEYYLPGINQVEVKHDIGLDFSRIIRAMLRQLQCDPGRRDSQYRDGRDGNPGFADWTLGFQYATYERCAQFHYTFDRHGCRTISGCIQRHGNHGATSGRICLLQMQGSLHSDPGEIQHFEITPEQVAEATFMRGKGCNHCQHTGYRGRNAVFELMVMNSTLREMTFRSEPAQNIRRQARLFGMKTLVEDALARSLIGKTTLIEVYKLDKGGH